MNGHKKLDSQLNLPLCQTRPLDLPADKQSELSAALADLLWNAAVETDYSAIDTPGDEA